MKTIYKIFLLALISSGSLFYSCETTELEQLVSPNAISPEQADPDLLLNTIQRAFVTNAITFNDRSAELTRIDYMFGRDYFNNYNSSTFDGVWSRTYSSIFANVRIIEQQNEANGGGLEFHLGVSKAIEAYTLMMLVDFLGDIPLSEALNPDEFPNPTLDDDATVYAAARARLDESKAFLSGASVGSATDFFYEGDTDNWTRLVNTLIMRHSLTTGNLAEFNTIASSGNFIADSSQDFEFKYGTQLLNPNTRHPDYNADYTVSGANIYQSMWLMRLMQDADAADGSDDDPRIRYYFFRQADCTPGASCQPEGNGETLSCSLESAPPQYAGIPYCFLEDGYWGRNHGDDDGTPPDNFTRTAVGVYPAGGLFDDNSFGGLNQDVGGLGEGIEPIILASYVDFWRAEVALAGGSPTAAAGFVEAGLTKSIAKVQSFGALDTNRDTSFEPDATTVSDFIAAKSGMITDTSDDSWNALAEQYFVTMFGGAGDAYNFYRRTGYPTTLDPNVEPDPGVFPRTFLYPSVEVIANPNVTQRQDNATQVFWDTQPAGPAFPPAN
ncbi:MAG: SusD/RagB family nutrient-binding outer membrane lipoprotein [Gilvibacter sp.]|nr:SusD/RagB family nutrient-binding outer membrane lipoprotein [Gilvibacter sp.]